MSSCGGCAVYRTSSGHPQLGQLLQQLQQLLPTEPVPFAAELTDLRLKIPVLLRLLLTLIPFFFPLRISSNAALIGCSVQTTLAVALDRTIADLGLKAAPDPYGAFAFYRCHGLQHTHQRTLCLRLRLTSVRERSTVDHVKRWELIAKRVDRETTPARRFTKGEIAQRLRMSRPALNRRLTGQTDWEYDKLIELAELLDTTVEELVSDNKSGENHTSVSGGL